MKEIKIKEIFDIFSKKPLIRKEKPNAKIIIDIHEKNSLINSELIDLGLETEFKPLKVADYLVGDVAIERKTVSDFISSLVSKRLLNQLE